MSTITALLIVQNEEKHIARAIESVTWADEIVVIDGGSTDKTIEIAKQYNAKIHIRPFDNFSLQRKFSLKCASMDWILGIDADEIITPALAEEIKEIIQKESTECAKAYNIERHNYFWGRRLQYIWKRDWQIRLIQRNFSTVSDSPVHESYIINGRISNLVKGVMLHYTYENIEQYVRKMNHYSTLAAPSRAIKKKIKIYHLFFHPLSTFLRNLFSRRGYKDGAAGIAVSFIASITNLLEFLKAYEIQNNYGPGKLRQK